MKLNAKINAGDPGTPERKKKKQMKGQAQGFHIRLSTNTGKEPPNQDRSYVLNLTPSQKEEDDLSPKS